MSVVIEYTVKPNPGSDLKTILEMTHESAALWRRHGGKVRLWAVTAGEVGDLVVSISFENFAAYGATFDKLNADIEYQAWHAIPPGYAAVRAATCSPVSRSRAAGLSVASEW